MPRQAFMSLPRATPQTGHHLLPGVFSTVRCLHLWQHLVVKRQHHAPRRVAETAAGRWRRPEASAAFATDPGVALHQQDLLGVRAARPGVAAQQPVVAVAHGPGPDVSVETGLGCGQAASDPPLGDPVGVLQHAGEVGTAEAQPLAVLVLRGELVLQAPLQLPSALGGLPHPLVAPAVLHILDPRQGGAAAGCW